MSVIRKPWGYEYLAYQNEDVALWVLHIKAGEQTSMHCHPKKTTGLVLLKGKAELCFLADSKTLIAPDKCMIRRGLFHRTKAYTDCILLEVETPVDKSDLVRLEDSYGRASQGYETEEEPVNGIYEFDSPGDYGLFVVESNEEYAALVGENDIVMFLKGGIGKTIDGRKHLATVPGDVGRAKIIEQVARQMEFVELDTLTLRVRA